jgi:hypothetical protein
MVASGAAPIGTHSVGGDFARPSVARVYDYSLGGKDCYEVDRRAFERIRRIAPRQGDVHVMNRRWLTRAVRMLAERNGIGQFLDLGAGLPTRDPLHVVAQECGRREVRVVYVDNDPLCMAYGRAMLERNENTWCLPSDLTDVAATLETAGRYLDLREPVGVLFGAVLHHISDEQCPAAIVSRYIDLLPAGSYVAISHYYDPGPARPELHALARRLEGAHLEAGLGSGRFRSAEEIHALFGSLELVEPGLTELDDWWPPGPPSGTRAPEAQLMLGGLGRKSRPGIVRVLPSRR